MADLAHSEVTPDGCSCTTEELSDGGRKKVLFKPALPSDCVLRLAATDLPAIGKPSWCSLG